MSKRREPSAEQKIQRALTKLLRAQAEMLQPALLDKHQVEQRVGLDITTIYRQMTRGQFPRPVKVGTRAVRWRLKDIQAWEDQLPPSGANDGRPR